MINIFTLNTPVKLIFGSGSLEKLGEAASGLGTKALIVTGKTSARKYGILQKTGELLAQSKIESIPFEEVTPNPLSTTVNKGVEVAKKEGCDLIVGIGGGSAMDTAKAIAICAVNKGEITDYQPGGKYEDQPPEKTLPVIEITTTAGTGSEYNRFLVITNAETNEKPGIGFESTYPALSIVDPELMKTVPADVTTDTGVDVLFHALEAYLGNDANMYTDMIAAEAIRLTVANLKTAIDDGENMEARTKMAWANTLAGQAIDIAGTVPIHGAGHPLSGHFNLTHGQTLSALGVTYLEHNHQANPEKFASLSKLLGYEGEGLSTEELAAKSPEALKNFLQSVGRDFKIGDMVELDDAKIKELARDTFKTMMGTIENNPRPLEVEDIERLYRDSL